MARYWTRTALAAAVATALVFPGAAMADDDTEAQLEQARARQAATEMSLGDIESQLATLSATSSALERQAAEAQAALISAQADLNDSIEAAQVAQVAANAAREQVEAAADELGRIGAAMYRDGASTTPMANYLTASSVTEATARQDAYERLGENAGNIVQEYEAKLALAQTMEGQAKAAADAQIEAASEVEQATAEAAEAAEAAKTQLANADAERAELVAALAAQRGTTTELEMKRQEEIEAARAAQAEEERQRVIAAAQREVQAQQAAAAAKAEAERRAAEAAKPKPKPKPSTPAPAPTTPAPAPTTPAPAPTTPAPAPTTPAPAPTTPAPAPTTPAPKPKPKPKPKPPAPKPPAGDTTNWKLRNSILAYGRQFMGTPYVWGGKSPAGWDCIGFAHYVYAHHGIQIAYSSHGAQFNGVRVSKADARPGDLLWWPGHVGIYTGNGMHMAAANPRAGTKEDVIWGNPQYRNVIGD